MTDPAPAWEGRAVEDWRAAWGLPRLVAYHTIESTNDAARALADAGAPAGTTVLADHQTRGRGQHGRSWHADPGRGVLLSVVLRPLSGPDRSPGVLPIRVGMAVARALERALHVSAGLKWPNDLMADGRKLGGILCEGALAGDDFFVVAGIGVNVLQREHDFPPGLDPRPVSLAMLLPPRGGIARAEVAGVIARAVAGLGPDAARPLSDAELREFAGRDILRDRPVSVDGAPLGRAAGLAADGALLVDGATGRTAVRSGTVRLAESAPGASAASRFRGAADVVSELTSKLAAAATSSTARLNAAWFAFDGALKPLNLRTN